jgi:ATP-dependent RNA helicase HrpA
MSTPPAEKALKARLADLMPRDERRLGRRLDGARKIRDPEKRRAVLAEIEAGIAEAAQRLEGRKASVPAITYPAELPVSQRKDDILAAIRDHQVVIVAGETGSGKTTQLPKICMELGRGLRGMIGHTQPRRLAARTVSERIAEELDVPVGGAVGYQVRFTDHVGDNTMVKVMTDGILLAEIQRDRLLRRYDTLIIDEAHERSLNIDFILGYLKRLLPRRPDLKVVITSATIDPERFSRHFGDAPIVEVSGRTYPVEVRYRPIQPEGDDDVDPDRDQTQAILDAVDELSAEGPGDILVFLSGEREIRDTAEALGRQELRHTEITPLYARLSAAEQHRVFQSHPGRRIVLATNVAETSLTVPGIRYVIDPGTARISRYSHRLKVQRLPIEAISQASANQRKGRCGRVAEGICVRLYSEQDFVTRPEFTDPEVLRTNLASVILQMHAAGLGEVADFPFLDPPDKRSVAAGVQLLEELGALRPKEADPLTALGRKLVTLPVDPRLGRMVLEADRNDCVREVMVIAAALSIQDPRERPTDAQQAADERHARFRDPSSDFLSYLNLWRYLREKQQELSGNQFRKMCRTEFLNYLRVREWQDIYSQLRQLTRTLGITLSDADASGDQVHRSLLAGLLSHLGLKDGDKRDYLGARGAKFAIFPGSALFKKPPRWVMAAELVETSRLWARVVAQIEPAWAESLAEHLVKRTYSEPHWEKKQGAVMAFEKVTLYGVPIVANRKVNYGRIDPAVSRELFIRHALVEGDWETHHAFFAANRELLDEVEDLEHRARRRDILVDDEALFDFYDARIPADVVSGRHFDSWWKKARRDDPELLTFSVEMLVNEGAGRVSAVDYPDTWVYDGLRLPLTYQFEPGNEADGVTVDVPLAALAGLSPDPFDWQVPGLREELVTQLIRGLPKAWRVNFVPAPDYARAVVDRTGPADGPLLPALEEQLLRMTGTQVPRDAWQVGKLPDHLRITFRVRDAGGAALATGKELRALQDQLKPKTHEIIASAAAGVERQGLTSWDLGELPKVFEHRQPDGLTVRAYPALQDDGASVSVRVFETEAEQAHAMWRGTRRLLLLTTASPVPNVQSHLTNQAKLALTDNPHRNVADLLDDCIRCAADKLMADAGGPAWDAAGFAALRDRVRTGLADTTLGTVIAVQRILTLARAVRRRLSGTGNPVMIPALTDARAQLDGLVYRGFVTDTGWQGLAEVPRYLQAIEKRLDRLPANAQRDRQLTEQLAYVTDEYRLALGRLPAAVAESDAARRIRWMIEELRVSLFAQALGTPYPVSEKRILRAVDEL